MTFDPRAAMLAAVADPDGDLAEAALWLAVEDHPGLDPAPSLALLDELGQELRRRWTGGPPLTAVPVMAALLRDRINLHGSGGADPRAHYLHTVLERGGGIPITCSTVWIAVGRRAGIPVDGIGLPGHFVVRVGRTLVDAFSGGDVLDRAEATRLVGRATGAEPEGELDAGWFEPQSPRAILARMSRNLRGCYATLSRWDLALRAADRCVDLLPEVVAERRDRGLLLWRAGLTRAALVDLRAYLDAVPAAPDRDAIDKVAARLRAFLN